MTFEVTCVLVAVALARIVVVVEMEAVEADDGGFESSVVTR